MRRIAHSLLLVLLWLLGGGLMLASGQAPLAAMLVSIGATLPVLVTLRVVARRDAAREKATLVPRGLETWRQLRRVDRLWVLLSIGVGLGVAAFGMSCRCSAG